MLINYPLWRSFAFNINSGWLGDVRTTERKMMPEANRFHKKKEEQSKPKQMRAKKKNVYHELPHKSNGFVGLVCCVWMHVDNFN